MSWNRLQTLHGSTGTRVPGTSKTMTVLHRRSKIVLKRARLVHGQEIIASIVDLVHARLYWDKLLVDIGLSVRMDSQGSISVRANHIALGYLTRWVEAESIKEIELEIGFAWYSDHPAEHPAFCICAAKSILALKPWSSRPFLREGNETYGPIVQSAEYRFRNTASTRKPSLSTVGHNFDKNKERKHHLQDFGDLRHTT